MLSRTTHVALLGLAFVAVVVHGTGTGQVCTQPVKLGIAIDESGSIASADFETVKTGIANFISTTSATTPGNQYYFNVFDNDVRSPMTGLKANVADDVANLVRGLTQGGGSTNIAAALDDLAAKLPTGALAVLFTDGVPTAGGDATVAATNLKSKGITLITIGIGSGIDTTLLSKLASSPALSFSDPNFTQLNALLNQALIVACPCPSCTNTCSVKVTAVSTSTNELAINNTVARDCKSFTKLVCQDVNGVLPAGVVITNRVQAMANATATATATAVAKVLGKVFFKGYCDVGTSGSVKLKSTAIAWANVTAEAYAKAISTLVGQNALADFRDFVEGEAAALTSACQKAIVTASESGFVAIPVGTSYPDWTRVLYINKSKTVQAVATAIAQAYVNAVTRFKLTAKNGELACSARCVGCEDIIA